MTALTVRRMALEAQGDGPAVILVHGLGGSSNSFEPLMEALRGFRCIRPDLPGSARSALPVEPLSIPFLAEAVAEAADVLHARPAHLVGHSMGALVCLHLAAARPDLAQSLSLLGPIAEPTDAARQRLRERAALARAQGMLAIADAVAEGGLAAVSRRDSPLAAAFVRESHMRQEAEAFAQSCEALAAASAADLRLVRCPVLIVTGEDDTITPPSAARALAERLKAARLHVLAGCGHWAPLERPLECRRLLAEFLGSQRSG